MLLLTYLACFFALLFTSNAAVIEYFSGEHCEGKPAGTRNIWDNSCATGIKHGFSSFRVKTKGGKHQYLTAYSRDACAGTATVNQVDATVLGKCYSAHNSKGASNAMGSRMKFDVNGLGRALKNAVKGIGKAFGGGK